MTARVLVVDDILANLRLLEAKLSAEYFEVITASNGIEALECMHRARPDIVLLDVMMPGMDGIEVCRRIQSTPKTPHVPIILVTALDQAEDRVRGLEAGADDFLSKPLDDLALFCRVRSLVRLKMLTDELRARTAGGEHLGLISDCEHLLDMGLGMGRPGKVLLIDDRGQLHERIRQALGDSHQLTLADDPRAAVAEAAAGDYELMIVNLDLDDFDGLRLCSQLRSLETTRQTPILIIFAPDEHQRMIRALEIGVNDYLVRPIDKQELLARVNTQVRRCRYTAKLRSSVQQSWELAITDPLTGLYNRRYMETQVAALVEEAAAKAQTFAVLLVDIDLFKAVNDTRGHDAGDRALAELGNRIRANLRAIDLPCRIGGEEFLIALPDTDVAGACEVAERLRQAVDAAPFSDAESEPLSLTISIGVAGLETSSDLLEPLLKRADDALYRAKRDGRNRVHADAA
ncbi:MAG TPA: PleD family two-component system response regulator [Aestuariivirgaceae bacterium]|nr:PleD family two-component system response regulator [Aestuariivirgaceae bacterium]